jgi:hypothetical protein
MTARLESVLNQVLPIQTTELLAAEPYERSDVFTYDTVPLNGHNSEIFVAA